MSTYNIGIDVHQPKGWGQSCFVLVGGQVMLGWLFGKQADIRQLNRDSRSILRFTREGYSPERQGETALVMRRTLAHVRDRMENDGVERAKIVDDLKNQHRGARRMRHDVHLTAFTLLIIYLRAEGFGGDARLAVTAIDDFLADWEHLSDEDADLVF
jgi:hypothetical protein